MRPDPDGDDTINSIEDAPEDLQGVLELKEDVTFPSSNWYGIPDLRRDMLLDKLPEPLDTWGGKEATPDDGVSWYIYNYGLASATGLPWERSILCFYTYDEKFESWWTTAAYYTAKVLNCGVKVAIVPDFSLWTDDPHIWKLWNVFRAQWLGRYFQEAGIKVIPRIQWADTESLKYCLLGIPKNPPVASCCLQTVDRNDATEMKLMRDGLRHSVETVQPETLIVYGSNVGHSVAEELKLPCKLVMVDNYVAKRRGVVFGKKERIVGDGVVRRG
jgi:hypothetical protein